jgi:glucose-6-phosphate 1-dehydrogenase
MSSPRADSCVLVIFGASGDLARRKLLPAIYNLAESGLLPDLFAIVGVARPAISEGGYRTQVREGVEREEGEPLDAMWQRISDRLHYMGGELDDPALYDRLKTELDQVRRRHGIPPNYLFYLAVPPQLFATVGRRLAAAGLADEGDGWRRLVVEKPFGYDLESARRLNAELTEGLREAQIYRIDHYLGKETVQNILAFRFANGIFEPIWNRRYVDHVQIQVAEEDGIGNRGAYYDRAGALRDIVQNHMFQLLALVCMEPPVSFKPEAVRDEKVKVLNAVTPLAGADVRRAAIRAQYAGYLQEPHVAAGSRTETYVAARLMLDNWRWAGVPFYLRTGKRLARRSTEVSVHFKPAPFTLFRETPVECTNPNVLLLRIQPEEGISLSFDAKVPGPLERLETVTMDFSYAAHFHREPSTGYETLLFDAMAGDQTLFHRMDIVEAGWQIVQPILDAWARDTASALPVYEPGSWGPAEADWPLEREGRRWRSLQS